TSTLTGIPFSHSSQSASSHCSRSTFKREINSGGLPTASLVTLPRLHIATAAATVPPTPRTASTTLRSDPPVVTRSSTTSVFLPLMTPSYPRLITNPSPSLSAYAPYTSRPSSSERWYATHCERMMPPVAGPTTASIFLP